LLEDRRETASPAGRERIARYFAGHAQSRKAPSLAGSFRLIHSLDPLNLARNLQKVLEKPSSGTKRPASAVQAVLAQARPFPRRGSCVRPPTRKTRRRAAPGSPACVKCVTVSGRDGRTDTGELWISQP
jgi:hypothetical protein